MGRAYGERGGLEGGGRPAGEELAGGLGRRVFERQGGKREAVLLAATRGGWCGGGQSWRARGEKILTDEALATMLRAPTMADGRYACVLFSTGSWRPDWNGADCVDGRS